MSVLCVVYDDGRKSDVALTLLQNVANGSKREREKKINVEIGKSGFGLSR